MAIIAKRYVDALYSSTNMANDREQILKDLREFVKVYNKNIEFKRVLSDPRLDDNIKIEIANQVLDKSNKIFIKFINLLILEKRINLVEDMLLEYDKKIRNLKKELLIKIIVASEIDDNQIGKIVEKFKKIYKMNTVKYSIEIDEKILGGIKVIVGNTIYDATIKSKIAEIF